MKTKGSSIIEFYIIFLTILGQIAIDLYLPSVHGMMTDLGMTQIIAQWTVSAYLFGYGFSQLLYGPISDRIGRRKIVIVGIALSLFGSIGCTFAMYPVMILVFRMVQGLGSGAASVIARAIMRDSFTGKRLSKASSHMAMAWSLVPILAPVLGGVIERQGGWRFNFGFLMLIYLVFIVIVLFSFPETCKNMGEKKDIKTIIREYFHLFLNSKFSLNMIILVLLFAVFSIFNVSSPFLLQEKYGLNTTQYSIALCIISLGYLCGSFINGKLINRIKSFKLTMMGIVFVLVDSFIVSVSVLMNYGIEKWEFIIGLAIIFVGLGLIFSNSLSECLQPFPYIAGMASAMYGFLVFVGGGIISALYSKYIGVTLIAFFGCTGIIAAIMLISHVALNKNIVKIEIKEK